MRKEYTNVHMQLLTLQLLILKTVSGTSLVAQQKRICLPMQGTQI